MSPLHIVGPTAVGKSELALALADRLDGEIVSVDSMQVYRGLDIGAAKPGAADRRRTRHHLIDVCDLTESFNAARFVALAREAERDIRKRGKIPVYCGGTGLYLSALHRGLGEAPPGDPGLRAALERSDPADLLRELRQKDPACWETIDRDNPRRVVRAIEVIRLTGRPFSRQRADWKAANAGKDSETPRVFALSRDKADLQSRIDARVDAMIEQGLVEETARLMGRGLERNAVAMQAIGYRQIMDHLRGRRSLEEAVERIKIKTRQYAKRQTTWFRRQLTAEWIPLTSRTLETALGDVLSRARTRFLPAKP